MKKRVNNFQKNVLEKHAPPGIPIILLLDNINLYRGGKKRHQRLFKQIKPNMWNFTVRGAIIPNCEGIEQLFTNEETSQQPQKEFSSVKASDMFIESNPDQLKAFEDAKDQYFVKNLHAGLNKIPPTKKDFSSMSEEEFNNWLKMYVNGLLGKDINYYNYNMCDLQEEEKKTQCPSETLVLPISLENNATITGTASVLENFGKEFEIPCNHSKMYMSYDSKKFDINAAREHHEFLYRLQEHKKEMCELEKQLTTIEKQLSGVSEQLMDDSESEDDCTDNTGSDKSDKTTLQKIDGKFKKVFDKIVEKMWTASQSIDSAASIHLIQYLKTNHEMWENAKDHHGCTILHHAVKNGNAPLVQTLINAGVNLNVKERCGATPLTLAVINEDEKMVKLLLDNFAICDDDYYTEVPAPKDMADKLELHTISNLIERHLSKENELDKTIWEIVECSITDNTIVEASDANDDQTSGVYSRSLKNCKTFVVGDQGTNKITRSVKQKSPSAYGWAAEVPGDLHARGYLYEVCKKTMGPGGFMHIAQTVMNRTKVTGQAFGDKKFQNQNLNTIDEAVRDVSMAYGIAAVQTFKASTLFPSKALLEEHKKAKGSHRDIILNAFKEWIKSRNKEFQLKYHSQLFTLFGPLRELYLSSIKCGNGVAREAVWMIMLPLFAQLKKRNYWTEAFVHVMNIIAAWPIAMRKLLQKNCSVSVKGREGHNIALDEWVETYLVQPLKNYASGHSTVEMLQLLTVNLEIIGAIRSAYGGRTAFNVHPTTRHSEQDPFPDQLKGMHFCLKEKFFVKCNQDFINKLANNGEKIGKVSQTLVDVHSKGKLKVIENFSRKLFNTFHDSQQSLNDNNDNNDEDDENDDDENENEEDTV